MLVKELDKPKRKRGGQPNNKNAVGNCNYGNQNALKHGAYSHYYYQYLRDICGLNEKSEKKIRL